MRLLTLPLLLLLAAGPGFELEAASAKFLKVLPQYLDREGRYSVSPSLFDRDAYQAHLRRQPGERGGLQFAVQWKAPRSWGLTMRLELRGARGMEPTTATIELPVRRRGLFGSWSKLQMGGEEYRKFGELVAWRTTLWLGNQQVAEQRSFLW